MIKAVLFDLDNTIVDYIRFKTTCIDAAVRAMIDEGLPLDIKSAREIFVRIFKTTKMEDRTTFQRFLKRAIGRVDYRLLAVGIVAYRRARQHAYHVYPGMKRVLNFLKKNGIKVGIVTDAPKIKAWIRLAEIGLHNEFDVVVTYDDSKVEKPNKRPFLLAVRKLGIRPSEAMFVGDNIDRDIVGAKNVGMVSVFAKYGEVLMFRKKKSKEKPDYVISKPSELISIVKKNYLR